MAETSLTPRRNSLRWRIMLWILVVTAVALASVVLLTRAMLVSQVHEDSNSDVTQELEEFRQFATTEAHDTTDGLISAYMRRQIPDDEELFVGRTDQGLVQHDFTSLDNRFREPLPADDPLIAEVFNSGENSGVFTHPEHGRSHWGRVDVVLPTGDDAEFAVINFAARDLAAANSQVRWLALFALIGLLTAGLIAWLIAGQIIAPIRKLKSVAGGISDSDLTRRVPVESDNEIGQLARTFNAMLDRIEAAYRNQRRFVDDAGHELRTPITVVRGQLELLEESSEEQRRRSVALSTAELDRMSRMVDDMLTLAVADSGGFITARPVDVAELAIDIEDKASTISDRARLVEVAEGTVELDEQRVTEAVLELFGNALRYSDDVVEIGTEFRGAGDDRVFRVWVRDRGKGVPADRVDELFDRFSRGERHGTSRPGGAGLGLSIVQAIAQAHGGRAVVDSTVGLGSVFGIHLPAPETTAGKEEQ